VLFRSVNYYYYYYIALYIHSYTEMGIEFRGSHYKRDVHFGKRTVKEGEAVAVWDVNGIHTQIIGPRLVRLFFSTINFLDRRTASPTEYLEGIVCKSISYFRLDNSCSCEG